MSIEHIVNGVIALGLLMYLAYVLTKPERL
jgi:K+-transporting ATPase KdpF subunit